MGNATDRGRPDAYTPGMQVRELEARGSAREQHMTSAARVRRASLLARLGVRAALIPAGYAPARNYVNNPYPFRASSHFLYLVGLALEGALLWLDGEDSQLLLPAHDPLDALWHAQPLPDAALSELTGLPIRRDASLAQLARGRSVATPPSLGAGQGQLARALGRPPGTLGKDEAIDGPLLDALIALRLVHDDAAQSELRRAAQISVEAHRVGMRETHPGKRESEITAAMEAIFRRANFTTAYGSIVTVRGEILHNLEHDGELRAGELLLADVGGETDSGYAADITRTWPVSGTFSSSQREIYRVVLQAQRAAIARAKPGVRYRDVHLTAMRSLSEGLVALGILRGDPDDLVARGAHALFMPHGIGHLLGLDVHDMEDLGDRAGYAPGLVRDAQFGLSYLRLDRVLAPGMAVTIEPGFYQVPFLLADPARLGIDDSCLDRARLARFADVRGIRIEDDVLVTHHGCEVLTFALAKTVADVEAIMASPAD
jgi:Xaa-Pro aminopeptidase